MDHTKFKNFCMGTVFIDQVDRKQGQVWRDCSNVNDVSRRPFDVMSTFQHPTGNMGEIDGEATPRKAVPDG